MYLKELCVFVCGGEKQGGICCCAQHLWNVSPVWEIREMSAERISHLLSPHTHTHRWKKSLCEAPTVNALSTSPRDQNKLDDHLSKQLGRHTVGGHNNMNTCMIMMQSNITALQEKVVPVTTKQWSLCAWSRGIIKLIPLLLLSQCGKSSHCVLIGYCRAATN